ncbi:MAG: serine hydrolase domain-containing protein, partial [Gammaproteobacteria bacterium]|nr:serine hydrolase domain-containing protein [Gammaproteobacteria bacterium]
MKKHNIRFIRFIFISLLTLGLSACGGGTGDTTGPAIPTSGIAGDGQLDQIVESIRQKHKLPALAAITIRNGQIIEKSAMGYRSDGVNIPVTVNDQWHIGSITKSMTCLLAALLVRDGFIEWTSTLADIFPELVGTMRPEYADVRLDELLSHTSGLPLVIPNSTLYYTDTRSLPEQRQEV